MSKYLTFGELPVEAWFIGLPLDGDNHGHGGYKGIYQVFVKLFPQKGILENAANINNGRLSHMPDSMYIIRVK